MKKHVLLFRVLNFVTDRGFNPGAFNDVGTKTVNRFQRNHFIKHSQFDVDKDNVVDVSDLTSIQ